MRRTAPGPMSLGDSDRLTASGGRDSPERETVMDSARERDQEQRHARAGVGAGPAASRVGGGRGQRRVAVVRWTARERATRRASRPGPG